MFGPGGLSQSRSAQPLSSRQPDPISSRVLLRFFIRVQQGSSKSQARIGPRCDPPRGPPTYEFLAVWLESGGRLRSSSRRRQSAHFVVAKRFAPTDVGGYDN